MIHFPRLPHLLLLSVLASAGCRTAAPNEGLALPVSSAWKEPSAPSIPEAAVARGEKGMVVTAAPLATTVGVSVLRGGGNAVDAAVATAFALAVVHPGAGNLGGGGFAVVRGVDGSVSALDFREVAPRAAGKDLYSGRPESSLEGHLSVGVPGSVAGLWALHQKYGAKPWADLVAPSIALAKAGFEVSDVLAQSIADAAGRLGKFPASAAQFLPSGKAPEVGSRLVLVDLARTLERLARDGPSDFYSGETADLLVAEMKANRGLITKEDLAAYAPVWRSPIRFEYRGLTGYSMPPPSSGGVVLALTANLVGGFDLTKAGWHSPKAVHVVAESWRRAYALRNRYLGDPDFVKDMPLAKLLAPAFPDGLRKEISLDRASLSSAVPAIVEGEHTTHFAVADAEGMVVSLTTTLNLGFGSAVTVEGAGFLLNDEMDDFATQPGRPNAFGLVQGERNAIAGGKRMLSSMSPTIVVDAKGAPVMALGAQGGSFIISAVFQVMSNVVDFGLDVGQAVAARRFHHQHLPDQLSVESGALTHEAWDALGAKGHARQWVPKLGCSPALVRSGGAWTGAADPREGGLALGE